jgi:hypothetical protein
MWAQTRGGAGWKIRTPHRKTGEMPFHEWYWAGDPVKADTLGRRNDRMYEAQWARVVCLYADCPAEAMVRIGDMVAVLPVVAVTPRVTQPVPPPVPDGPPYPTSQDTEAVDTAAPSTAAGA